jgi:radical SAM superfamily enzyme YgiQ (UPF0313 family)
VLLVSTNTMTRPYSVYPLGLDYVIDSIAAGHEVKSVDMNELQGGGQGLASVVEQFRPDVIGISIRNIDNIDEANTETFVDSVRGLVSEIRRCSRAAVVLGGSGFTILPREFMDALGADFGLIGEGERFPLLLKAIEGKSPVQDIPGVIVPGGPAVYPAPLRDLRGLSAIPDNSYRPLYLARGGMLNLQTKRGCPFECVYCTYPLIEGTAFRLMDPAEAARNARMLQDAGAKYIYITDSTVNGSCGHSLEVALEFKKQGVSIPWGGLFAPIAAPGGYYRTLADCGLRHVEFGTEACCDTVLEAYGKPFRVKDVLDTHRQALEAGLHVAHYLMPGGPGETEETLQESLANCDRLEKTVFFLFGGVRIYPNTRLFETALREGQTTADADFLQPSFYWSPGIERDRAVEIIRKHAAGRTNWIIGSGPSGMFRMMERLHAWGNVGPLWERLIR